MLMTREEIEDAFVSHIHDEIISDLSVASDWIHDALRLESIKEPTDILIETLKAWGYQFPVEHYIVRVYTPNDGAEFDYHCTADSQDAAGDAALALYPGADIVSLKTVPAEVVA